LGNSSKKSFLF